MIEHRNERRQVDENDRIAILAVLIDRQDTDLQRVIAHTRWQMKVVHSVAEAVDAISTLPIAVVLCDRELDDGDWLDVVRATDNVNPQPPTIVLSDRKDDHLWAEVLNRGGYDLLLRPLNAREVYSLVPMAWRRWSRGPARIKSGAQTNRSSLVMAGEK
jgi:DNA-binding response OmpR family regulator